MCPKYKWKIIHNFSKIIFVTLFVSINKKICQFQLFVTHTSYLYSLSPVILFLDLPPVIYTLSHITSKVVISEHLPIRDNASWPGIHGLTTPESFWFYRVRYVPTSYLIDYVNLGRLLCVMYICNSVG